MDMVGVVFDSAAQEYIQKKGGSAHIVASSGAVGGCCSGLTLAPTVRTGIPRDEENYRMTNIDEISFYYPKEESFRYVLEIGLEKILGFSSLEVKNWKVF